MTAFTPPPWHVEGHFIVARDPSGKRRQTIIAEIVKTGEGAPAKQQRGNASLTAAAPQLFTALVDMEAAAELGELPSLAEREASKAALAKAMLT